jgi:MarR family 2-MHQ and catechol resistance regulon transcriptional repressor
MPTRHQGSPDEVEALDAYIKLMRAANSVAGRMNRELVSSRLTESQFAVLEVLMHHGPLHQCQIAAKILKSGANLTTVLDNLQKRGLIIRQPDEQDRRSTIVELTPQGRRLIGDVFPVHARAIRDLMSALNSAEKTQLGDLCRKLGLAATASTNLPE